MTAETASCLASSSGSFPGRPGHRRSVKMGLDWDGLKLLSEVPSVATACGPIGACLRRLLPGYEWTEVTDGGLVALPQGERAEAARLLFVTHVDEIGGFVLFPEEGGFGTRLIGNKAEAFAN